MGGEIPPSVLSCVCDTYQQINTLIITSTWSTLTIVSFCLHLFTSGVITKSTDAEWKRFHQLSLSILKEFGFGVKNEMQERILTEVEAMVDYVQKKNGQNFAPRIMVSLIATNIINNIMFGERRKYQDGIGELYIQIERAFRSADLAFEFFRAIRFLPRYSEKYGCIRIVIE